MELRQLRYFVAVAEAGSFTAAAAQLHMSQPPLSMAIASLERELGVQLLLRSARGARLTDAGGQLLESAHRILEDVAGVSADLARHATGRVGRISLAAVPILMWSHVPRFLKLLQSSFPDVDVRLIDPPPLQAIDMLASRSVELALIATATDEDLAEQYGEQLRFEPCGSLDLVAVFPPEDAGLPNPVQMSAFSGRRLLMPRRTLAVRSLSEIVEDALTDNGVVPSGRQTVETIPSCLPLVAAGLGITVLPQLGDRAPVPAGLAFRRIEPALQPLQVTACWRKDLRPGPALQRMQELILEGGVVGPDSETTTHSSIE